MTQPTSFGSQSPSDFINSALRALTVSDVEGLLSQLPVTPEDEYIYDLDNPDSGWRPGNFHWIPVGAERGNAGRIKQANQPVNPIAERTVNGMEAMIEMARHRELLANASAAPPTSPRDAVLRYFSIPSLDQLPKLDASENSKATAFLMNRARAKDRFLVLTGSMKPIKSSTSW